MDDEIEAQHARAPDPSGGAGPEVAIDAYLRARAWMATAEFVVSDSLFEICQQVIAGSVTMREASRRTGIAKSSLARSVEQVRAGVWRSLPLTPHLDVDAFEVIAQDMPGTPMSTPFESVINEHGKRVIRWLDEPGHA